MVTVPLRAFPKRSLTAALSPTSTAPSLVSYARTPPHELQRRPFSKARANPWSLCRNRSTLLSSPRSAARSSTISKEPITSRSQASRPPAKPLPPGLETPCPRPPTQEALAPFRELSWILPHSRPATNSNLLIATASEMIRVSSLRGRTLAINNHRSQGAVCLCEIKTNGEWPAPSTRGVQVLVVASSLPDI